MSAFGPKQTCRRTQSMSLLGVKRTWPIAVQMSLVPKADVGHELKYLCSFGRFNHKEGCYGGTPPLYHRACSSIANYFNSGCHSWGGLYGLLILQTTGYSPYGWQIANRPAVEILFPLVGASIGFLVSATGAVFIFMLAEISANTRTTAVMLEELAGARRTANRDRMR